MVWKETIPCKIYIKSFTNFNCQQYPPVILNLKQKFHEVNTVIRINSWNLPACRQVREKNVAQVSSISYIKLSASR
jgi:hypothetical protein